MNMHPVDLEDTIAAISTPIGEGGIGIVRMSGKNSIAIADQVFRRPKGKKPSEFKNFTVHVGWVVGELAHSHAERGNERKKSPVIAMSEATKQSQKNEIASVALRQAQGNLAMTDSVIDEALLTVMRAPKSYTRQDMVEISCHGGILPMRRILDLVLRKGARLAEPGEFTKRAFLNGRMDLVQAEAVLDVIRAKTDLSLRVAMNQLEGQLSKRMKEIREELLNLYAHVEASIDFPDEDLELLSRIDFTNRIKKVRGAIGKLLENSQRGEILREGMVGVICGKPNVGKSSLLNALLGQERAIVTPIPGTTRDIIEESINLDGIPMRLVDTAGIRESHDIIELEGIQRSRLYMERADVVLVVVDASAPLDREDEEVLKKIAGRPSVTVVNKIDLPIRANLDLVRCWCPQSPMVQISATQREGLGTLARTISQMIWNGQIQWSDEELVTNVRHRHALERVAKALGHLIETIQKKLSAEFISVDIRDALDAIGEIVGETTTEDLLDRIFSKFCIGK